MSLFHPFTARQFLSVGVVLVFATSAQAATYFVSSTGNDTRPCASARDASTPRKTLTGGVQCLVGGDTLIVGAGTYEGGFGFRPPRVRRITGRTTTVGFTAPTAAPAHLSKYAASSSPTCTTSSKPMATPRLGIPIIFDLSTTWPTRVA